MVNIPIYSLIGGMIALYVISRFGDVQGFGLEGYVSYSLCGNSTVTKIMKWSARKMYEVMSF
jgi:hypothetical protein